MEDNLENDSVDNDHHFHYIVDKNSYFCLKGEKDNAMFISLSLYGNGKDKTNGVLSTFVISAEVVERS